MWGRKARWVPDRAQDEFLEWPWIQAEDQECHGLSQSHQNYPGIETVINVLIISRDRGYLDVTGLKGRGDVSKGVVTLLGEG